MPLFSVIIPTWNRADLLKDAIQSVLEQNCDDYEIVVSDNDSHDDTYKMVNQFINPKIKYYNTGKHLTSSESWNYAYNQSNGKYILMLGDDDYLLPTALQQAKLVIEKTSTPVVAWEEVYYFSDTCDASTFQDLIIARKYTNNIHKVSSKDMLKIYFNLEDWGFKNTINTRHPSSICISRNITEKIVNKYGKLFEGPCADTTAIPRSLIYTDYIFIISKPLVVLGRNSRSMNDKFITDPKTAWQEHTTELKFVPCKGKYNVNLYSESLLKVKFGDPNNFKDYELNTETYAIRYYQSMLDASRIGINATNDMMEFNTMLSNLPSEVQKNVRQFIEGERKGLLVNKLRNSFLYNISITKKLMIFIYNLFLSLKRRFNKNNNNDRPSIRGKEVGVTDVVTCASSLLILARTLKQPVEAWDCNKEAKEINT